jgi:hypothetical protein
MPIVVLRTKVELGEGNLDALPVGSAPREQRIVEPVVPGQVVFPLQLQVQRVFPTIHNGEIPT